jgi:hypothetical protein
MIITTLAATGTALAMGVLMLMAVSSVLAEA